MELYVLNVMKAIPKFTQRKNSGNYELLTENQKRLYDVLLEMSGGNSRKLLKQEDIRNELRHRYPDEKSIFPKNTPVNFCYDRINIRDRPSKFLVASTGTGRFRFVGFDWDSGKRIDVYWTIWVVWGETFKVGYYKNKEFFWDFDIVLQYLREYE